MSKRRYLLALAGLTGAFVTVLAIGALAAFAGHAALDLAWSALGLPALFDGLL